MKTKIIQFILTSALLLVVTVSLAADIDPAIRSLVNDLQSGDAPTKAIARQLLPNHGLVAVPAMISIMNGNDPALAKAAYDIILQVVNDVSSPGREKDRKKLTDMLMPLVSKDRPEKERITGLRFLDRLVPPGYDVSPIAAMLTEPALREKARTALQRIGTEEAQAALSSALSNADPEFQIALLNALGELQDSESLDAILRLAVTGAPEVQPAAIRALAWTGNPSYLATAESVRDNAKDNFKNDATDALLRLVERVAQKGGNWDIAVKTYEEIAKTSQGSYKDAALAALGNIGDERHVPLLLEAAQAAGPPTSLIALRGLQSLQGPAVTRRLVAKLPELDVPTQISLLPVLASRNDEQTLPALVTASKSTDSGLHLTGIKALGSAGLASGVAPLFEVVQQGSGEDKVAAIEALFQLGGALTARGAKADAAGIYIKMWGLAQDAALKARALQGLTSAPVPEGFDMVMAAADDPGLRDQAISALQGVAGALVAAGRGDKAVAAYKKMADLHPSGPALQAITAGLQGLSPEMNVAEMVGFITNWWVTGPFPLGGSQEGWDATFVNEPNIDLGATYDSSNGKVGWKKVKGTNDIGKVDLLKEVANCNACLGYAYTEFEAADEADAVLSLGVDDGEKVWFNGELLLNNFVQGGLTVDRDKVKVHLKKGTNTVLLKVYQNAMPWEFCMRILTPEGVPLLVKQKSE